MTQGNKGYNNDGGGLAGHHQYSRRHAGRNNRNNGHGRSFMNGCYGGHDLGGYLSPKMKSHNGGSRRKWSHSDYLSGAASNLQLLAAAASPRRDRMIQHLNWDYNEGQQRKDLTLNKQGNILALSHQPYKNGGTATAAAATGSTAGSTASPRPAPAAEQLQVVLYRDRSVVVWDQLQRSLRVRSFSQQEAQHLSRQATTECPLCGQSIDLDRYAFEAKAYFQVLQEAFNAWKYSHHNHRRRSYRRPSLEIASLPPAKDPDKGGNPFTSEPYGGGPQCMGDDDDMELKNIPQQLLVNNYYHTFFEELRPLGSGSYGQVFLCQHRLDDLSLGYYAVKKIPVGDSKEWLTAMLKEVKMRESLHHQNIVSYKHSWLELSRASEFGPKVPWLYVLMEFCNGGDLEQLINNVTTESQTSIQSNNFLTDDEVWIIFLDILTGLHHLHHAGILHRDLKPSNILIRQERDRSLRKGETIDAAQAVLADFGTAEFISENAAAVRRTGLGFTGTVEYTAPELLEMDSAGRFTTSYDFKSDMWSLGLILHFLAYGVSPFSSYAGALFAGEVNVRAVVQTATATTADPQTPQQIRATLLAFAQELREKSSGQLNPDLLPLGLPPGSVCSVQRPLSMRQLITALLSSSAERRPSCDDLVNNEFLRPLMLKNYRAARSQLTLRMKRYNIELQTDDLANSP